jgi:hypothetical protein
VVTRYRTIVSDPPWDHSDGTGRHWGDEALGGVTETLCPRCGQYAASDTGCTRCATDDSEYAERSAR